MLRVYALFPCTIWWFFAVAATAGPSVPAVLSALPADFAKDLGLMQEVAPVTKLVNNVK